MIQEHLDSFSDVPLTNRTCCHFADVTIAEQGFGVFVKKKPNETVYFGNRGAMATASREIRATGSFF